MKTSVHDPSVLACLLLLLSLIGCGSTPDSDLRGSVCLYPADPDNGVPLDFIDRAERAYDVVQGRLVWVEVKACSEFGLPCTLATIQIEASLRGGVGDRIQVWSPGAYELTMVVGLPLLKFGDDAIIFLWDDWDSGGDPYFIIPEERGYIVRRDSLRCFGVEYDEVISQLAAELGLPPQ